jgi:AcrR family transcriptional regulator
MVKAPAASAAPKSDPRVTAIEALMALAARRPWDEIELGDIAAEAGISLSALRDLFPSKGAMLAGFGRMIDGRVLAHDSAELANEPIQERVFDVVMRRLDALAPYKPALVRLAPTLQRDPVTLLGLNGASLNSWRYLLASANVSTEDSLGPVRVQGAVLMFARVLDVWLRDDDPALSKTMAELDRQLKSAGQIMRRIEDLRKFTAPLRGLVQSVCNRRPGGRKRARSDDDGDMTGDSYAAAI